MRRAVLGLLAFVAVTIFAREASAQWWVGGDSYSLRVDKYDSFYGEARPMRWSIERPPGTYWLHMVAKKHTVHGRKWRGSGGYPAIYEAAYSRYYYAGVPAGEAEFYQAGYPEGFPVDFWTQYSDAQTVRPSAVQVDPLPGDRKESDPYPVEETVEEIPPAEPVPPAASQVVPPRESALLHRPDGLRFRQ